MRKIFAIICLVLFLVNSIALAVSAFNTSNVEIPVSEQLDDYDPLVDIEITLKFLAIRALDEIDSNSDPDFFIKTTVNEEEFISPTWEDEKYLYNCWNITKNVPDDNDLVEITIQLWDDDENQDEICDITKKYNNEEEDNFLNIIYDIKTGLWSGDDHNIGDTNGYGRGNGCSDGSFYTDENDCEIYFEISQNDYDNDGLPYWVETYVYQTDPEIDNTGDDTDADEIPIEWEHKWGYNPLIFNDHEKIDIDADSINNYEEYLTDDFRSDPYCKDLFLEIDYMEDEINGEQKTVSEISKEMMKNPFHRRDIIYHIDTEIYGGEIIPYEEESSFEKAHQIWKDYFMHNDENNWRRGVFHYCIFVHYIKPGGFAFSGDVAPYWGYIPGTDAFVLSFTLMESKDETFPFKSKDYVFASAIMHEMGHNFGIRAGRPWGCDARRVNYPWQIGWWLYRPYKSIMNYQYTYSILDYSDGSHGKRDSNDWANIDLSYFEIPEKKSRNLNLLSYLSRFF